VLQTKLQELGHSVQVKFVKVAGLHPRPSTGGPAASHTASPLPKAVPTASLDRSSPAAEPQKRPVTPLTLQDFKNDPLIQKALEIFRGHIVEIRA